MRSSIILPSMAARVGIQESLYGSIRRRQRHINNYLRMYSATTVRHVTKRVLHCVEGAAKMVSAMYFPSFIRKW